jgi:hypothetical protein
MEEREAEHKPEVWAVVRTALDVDQEGGWNLPTTLPMDYSHLSGEKKYLASYTTHNAAWRAN